MLCILVGANILLKYITSPNLCRYAGRVNIPLKNVWNFSVEI